jgi:hypothetical protein
VAKAHPIVTIRHERQVENLVNPITSKEDLYRLLAEAEEDFELGREMDFNASLEELSEILKSEA